MLAFAARTPEPEPPRRRPRPADARAEGTAPRGLPPPAIRANLALLLISAGLIGALFIATVLLINVWGLDPLGAAAGSSCCR